MRPGVVEVWTDGSGTSSGPWGWAALLRFLDLQGEVHETEYTGYGDEGTNNVAELSAVIHGLDALTRACHVEVITDSRYVMDGFHPCDGKPEGRVARWKRNGWKCGPDKKDDVKNQDLWQRLDAAVARHLEVEWRHVKGHSKIECNERVDKLAGEARQFALGNIALNDLMPEAEAHPNELAKEAAA